MHSLSGINDLFPSLIEEKILEMITYTFPGRTGKEKKKKTEASVGPSRE